MKPSRPKPTQEQRELEAAQAERLKELRVENARETAKAYQESVSFRMRMRGIHSMLSNGFQGFPS